jgi:hypothetical protein
VIRELLGPNTDTERQDGQAGEAVSTARSYFVRTDIKIVFNVHVTSRIHLLVSASAAAFKMCILIRGNQIFGMRMKIHTHSFGREQVFDQLYILVVHMHSFSLLLFRW